MRAPPAAQLLTAWELASRLPPLERGLLLLASAMPEASEATLWSLPIGERDACLLELRQRLFGATLELVSECPACGNRLESTLDVERMRGSERASSAAEQTFETEAWCVVFRVPTCLDLAHALARAATGSARVALLERCVVAVRDHAGEERRVAALPEPALTALIARMAELDPLADICLELCCPSCAHRFVAPFDIGSVLWKEVHVWAQRTLHDVHCLARAYGWSEAETLALSATRRRLYLELCRA